LAVAARLPGEGWQPGGLRLPAHCAPETAFRRRHWPASFLWSSPANAGYAVGVLTTKIPAAYMATRAGKTSLLWIVARAVGKGFDRFLFDLALLAFGGCSPYVGSRRRRAGRKR